MNLTPRQEQIIAMVKAEGPLTSEQIADKLALARATLRPDLAVLTMAGYLDARPKVGYYYTEKNENAWFTARVRQIKVGDVKAPPLVVKEQTSVYDAIISLFLEDAGSVFVVDKEGALTGIASRKDFLRIAVGGSDIHQVPVGMIMTRMPNIITTTPEESIYDAARKIIEHQVDGLPVVQAMESSGEKTSLQVIGKVTKTTITRIFTELADIR